MAGLAPCARTNGGGRAGTPSGVGDDGTRVLHPFARARASGEFGCRGIYNFSGRVSSKHSDVTGLYFTPAAMSKGRRQESVTIKTVEADEAHDPGRR